MRDAAVAAHIYSVIFLQRPFSLNLNKRRAKDVSSEETRPVLIKRVQVFQEK